MPENMIIYGAVVDQAERRRIEKICNNKTDCILWHDDPDLLKPGTGTAQVYVDLDDPKFKTSDFLVSLATAGKKIRLIGKSQDPSLEDSIQFSKLGVSEILSPDQCLCRLNEFLNNLADESTPKESSSARIGTESLIGSSPKIASIRRTIDLLSDVDFPSALILGETGTGKSLIAKLLHNSGLRRKHNMIEVNCSTIPDQLFESELFGHSKGAFTDAKSEKIGLFEYAQKGTLFLDEVGNLSAPAQAKLLKILEDKRLRKVGDINEKEINVRVVAATNLDLEQAVEDGKFREDLYFRLNLLTIEIPPLRERPDDILPLVYHFIKFYSSIYDKKDIGADEEVTSEMKKHPWPGNVRQLSNIIERAILLSKNKLIRMKDIEAAFNKGRITAADRRKIQIEIPHQGISLEEIEQNVVKQVLNMCNWNKTETAKFLSISRPRLRRRSKHTNFLISPNFPID
jgi:DNA-binding NtrC family response regulator